LIAILNITKSWDNKYDSRNMADLNQLITAAIGGGLFVKVLDILYQEIKSKYARTETAKRFVDGHLDQLLKSADELVGKLLSLAREDFKNMKERWTGLSVQN
jgi:hypothetical protein